jgi:hypothetical protein
VTVCCSLSQLAHAQQAGTELGVEAYTEYEEALRQDLAQVGGGSWCCSAGFGFGSLLQTYESSSRFTSLSTLTNHPPNHPTEPTNPPQKARAAAGLPVPREDQLKIAVRHVPLHLAALDAATFVLPAAGAAASMAV